MTKCIFCDEKPATEVFLGVPPALGGGGRKPKLILLPACEECAIENNGEPGIRIAAVLELASLGAISDEIAERFGVSAPGQTEAIDGLRELAAYERSPAYIAAMEAAQHRD